MQDLLSDHELPEFREMGITAVRLLQGVVYAEDRTPWEILLAHERELTDYFARIGLSVVIDRSEELAYLRPFTEGEVLGGYERLPRLFRRTPLGYDATLLSVLLRDEYRRFEDEDLDNERCVVTVHQLLEDWRVFFPAESDDPQLRRRLQGALKRLEDLKYVTKVESEEETWEVRRILKARLPIDDLESLRERLRAAEQERTS